MTKPISEEFDGEDQGLIFDELTDRFNERLREVWEKVQDEVIGSSEVLNPDMLNNKNRLMKAPLSIHRKLNVVVHPVDPDDSDFDPEPPSVTDKVLRETEDWFESRDSNPEDIETLIPELLPDYEGFWDERLVAWVEDEKKKREEREKERLEYKRKMEEKRREQGKKGRYIKVFPSPTVLKTF